jgi:hypothetical protein
MAHGIQGTGSFTGTSGSVTVGSGDRRKLVCAVSRENANALSGVTFDGSAMTSALVHVHNTNNLIRTDWLYFDILASVAVGSYTVAIGSGGTGDTTVHWWQTSDSAAGALENALATNVNNSTTFGDVAFAAVSADSLILATAITGSATPTWSFSNAVATRVSDGAETNYTTGSADGLQTSSGSKTARGTASATSGDKIVSAISLAQDLGSPTPTPAFGRYGVRSPSR